MSLWRLTNVSTTYFEKKLRLTETAEKLNLVPSRVLAKTFDAAPGANSNEHSERFFLLL